MKISNLFAALTVTCVPVLSFAAIPTLEGSQWELSARECKSGAVPNDAFKIGRDIMKFSFNRGSYNLVQTIDRCSLASGGNFAVALDKYLILETTMSNSTCGEPLPTEKVTTLPIQSSSTVMQLEAGGFEDRGTCPRGDTLVMTFVKQ